MNPTIIIVIAVVVALLAIMGFLASRLRTVRPNTALIVVSLGGGVKTSTQDPSLGATRTSALSQSRAAIHTTGRVFVMPLLQDALEFDLSQRRADIQLRTTDSNFVQLNVIGNLQFKFADDNTGLLLAAQRFYDAPEEFVVDSIKQGVEGMLKNIVNSMSYVEINSDREGFQRRVLESVKSELADMGVVLDMLNIVNVEPSDSSYATNLSAAEVARAAREARITRANAEQKAAKIENSTAQQIAAQERDRKLAQAGYAKEMAQAEAEAEAAAERARAEQRVAVAEQQKKALAAEAAVKEQQLVIDVVRPAEAAASAQIKQAEGERQAAAQEADANLYTQTKKAEADAITQTKRAEADAEARRVTASAEAEAVQATGLAQAEVIRRKGEAEGAATLAKADALRQYGEAGLAYEVVTRLPEMMSANADAVRGITNYTVVGTDGASDATKQATRITAETLAQVKALTGIDLGELLAKITGTVEPPAKSK